MIGFGVHLLRRQQREALGERKAHLIAEHGKRAGAGAIVLAVTVVPDMPHEVEVLTHRRQTLVGIVRAAHGAAGARVAARGIVAFRGHNAIRDSGRPARGAGCQTKGSDPNARNGGRIRAMNDKTTQEPSQFDLLRSADSLPSSGRSSWAPATTTSTRTRW